MKKRLIIALTALLVVIGIFYVCKHLGFNRSDSVDFRLYWHRPVKNIETGRYYVIDYSGPEYQGLLVKRVACTPAQQLTRQDGKFSCNGRLIAQVTITHSPAGEKYPEYQPDGSRGYFVIGDSRNSYDSRYFGVLPAFSFKREVRPLW